MKKKIKEMSISRIRFKIEEMLQDERNRFSIASELESLGFSLWGYTLRPDGTENKDEEIYGYDLGTPNGKLLVLINWIDGFVWIYRKDRVLKLVQVSTRNKGD